MRKNKLLLTTASVLCSAALTIGSSVPVFAETETDSIHLAIMTSGYTVLLQYAVDNGYFEELGLDVTVDYFNNGPAINEAVASGDIDFAAIGQMPSITGAIQNKSHIVAWLNDDEGSVQAYARNDSDIVSEGSGSLTDYPELYGSADTWKGKEILCAKGTSSHYALLATLADFGLSESDVTIVNMEGTAGAAAFAAGTGDVFYGFNPQWAEFYTNSDEYTRISTCKDAGKGLYNVLIASDEYYTEHSESVTKAIQAILKAEQDFLADTDLFYSAMYDWQNTYGTCTEDFAQYTADLVGLESLDAQTEKFEEIDGQDSEVLNAYETVSQFMVDNQVISAEDKETFDESGAIDPTYLYEAVENLKNAGY